MVDATFLVNLVEAVGILVGVAIAIMELRKGREERRNQISSELVAFITSMEGVECWISFLRNMDFSTYEEWSEKYGPYTNPEAAKHWYILVGYLDMLGLRILNGQIDLETVLLYVDPNYALMLWNKSLPIFQALRERTNNPDMRNGFEYLVNELTRRHPKHTPIPNPQRQRLMQK